MHRPLVSVVCLCYNQSKYVADAIQSVWDQSYENIELIIVDDASSDGSQEVIKEKLQGTDTRFIEIKKNVGNCAAFNQGFRASKGDYLIDLAADDLLLPERIEKGILDFEKVDDGYGVHFSDALICNDEEEVLHTHHKDDETIPQGDIYLELITRYFICPPTMMIKREVLEQLNGYDETLTYEDFDFWIRSSRHFKYLFNPSQLVKKRIIKNSKSQKQFQLRSPHMRSTLEVCRKISDLNQTEQEDHALIKRCWYEIRQCLKTMNIEFVPGYLRLIQLSRLNK